MKLPEKLLCSVTLAELVITIEMFHKDLVGALSLDIDATVSTDAALIGYFNNGILWAFEGGARPAIPTRMDTVLMTFDFVCGPKSTGTICTTVLFQELMRPETNQLKVIEHLQQGRIDSAPETVFSVKNFRFLWTTLAGVSGLNMVSILSVQRFRTPGR